MTLNKIIFIHKYNDLSGSPKVLSHVIKAVQKINVKTELITSQHEEGFLDCVADKTIVVPFYRSENKVITLIFYLYNQFILFFKCLRYFNKDVVFYINAVGPFGAALAAKLLNKHIIYHIHETTVNPKALKTFLRFVISLTADKVIFVSNNLKELEHFKSKQEYVLYNSLDYDFEFYEDKVKEINVVNEYNLLMVCSLKFYKGILEFIELAESLRENHEFNLVLIISADKNEINDYLNGIVLPENITVISRKTDISPFYDSSHLLLNLSRPDQWVETFGMTVIEGMSFGLPVIVPEVGGPREIVREGKEGFHVSCYDTEKLKNTVLKVFSNNDFYKKLSRNSIKRSLDFRNSTFEYNLYNILEIGLKTEV